MKDNEKYELLLEFLKFLYTHPAYMIDYKKFHDFLIQEFMKNKLYSEHTKSKSL